MHLTQPRNRRGASAVEFALVAPIFILLLFGIIEFGRAMMVQQIMTNATREGAREAALPESTSASVKNAVVGFLAGASIDVSADDVSVTPDPTTALNHEGITVQVAVPYSDVSWIRNSFIMGNLQASTTMRSERFQ